MVIEHLVSAQFPIGPFDLGWGLGLGQGGLAFGLWGLGLGLFDGKIYKLLIVSNMVKSKDVTNLCKTKQKLTI